MSDLPFIRLKSLYFKNFKVFEDSYFDFSDGKDCKSFVCFFGNNGSGKSTILDTIQMLFAKYDGYEEKRLKALLGKSVRHINGLQNGIYNNEDFLIIANISSSMGDYEIQLNKNGFIKDHPDTIKSFIYRLIYSARFDNELHQFQLVRDKWDIFKELFESVTGFEIEENTSLFNQSDDPLQAEMLQKYVLGFFVKKPNEIISHKECSAGERKIIKSFSTLLNKEFKPSIICIDNIEMHVETGRHIELIKCIKKCFSDSQIFSTTHSYHISKNFGDKDQLYDLRLIRLSDLIKNEPWRLYLTDEVKNSLIKLKSISDLSFIEKIEVEGQKILDRLNDLEEGDYTSILGDVKNFVRNVDDIFINDLYFYFKKIKIL